jgi:hypothetical protein
MKSYQTICKCGWKISNKKTGIDFACTNLIGEFPCGKKVYILNCCEHCYNSKREKNELEKIFDKVLTEFYDDAVEHGFTTQKQFCEEARRKIGLATIGKTILRQISENIEIRPNEAVFRLTRYTPTGVW